MQSDLLAILERHHIDHGFHGVALIRRGDEDMVHRGYGPAHRGWAIPNDPAIRFDIASVTKIFTAAAIMHLVDAGAIALETRVIPYLGIDDTAISEDVTVFHCLTHTSGIGDDADEEACEDYELLFLDNPNYAIRETRHFLPQFIHKPPVFAPGTGVRYNNVAFVLLGLVIEQASGLTYRDYVRRHIFAPAGMTGADFCAMDGTCANLAEHYKRIARDGGEVEWRKNIYSYPPIGSPDGGATVTADDLARFLRALRETTLLGEPASAELLRPQVKRGDSESGSLWNGFALEFELDHAGAIARLGKDGINAGVASNLAYFPASDTTCVLLANHDCDVWALQDDLDGILLADS